MKQESKLTWAKIYLSRAYGLKFTWQELKDDFTLDSRQNLCTEKYFFVFIQINPYPAVDFNFL